uniref:F-box domain-containing protein n=1 Tax=Triticum urartu TaxID=4572 RepID=A0A8R7VE88_TRIUA
MEALGAPRSPPPATAATSAVLDDDDLLGEILLRVTFPTSLVRTALVCKSWLRLASDPVFLRRFRDLHPPSFLGFYVKTGGTKPPRFVPMPQPPELA